jgi:outer membrane biosynthesis protein TonB
VPKNEDGEFELILANRQLLSVFFIVVILLGVFFTMGYIVGRNSGPAPVDVASRKPDSKPMVVDSPAPQETPAPVSAPQTPAPTTTKQQQPPPDEPKAEPKAEEPVKKEAPAKKEKEKAKEKSKPAPASAEPVAGQTYLQLAATAKAEADVMVDLLHQKRFKAVSVQIPEKPTVYRILVGPLADGTLNKTKSDLQSAGFPGDKAIKKVY